jgi:hypothetical protein
MMNVKSSTVINVGSLILLLLILLSCKAQKQLLDDAMLTTTVIDTIYVDIPVPTYSGVNGSGEVINVTVPVAIPIERVVLNDKVANTTRKGKVKVVDRSKSKVIVRNNDIGAIIHATDSAQVTAPITITKTTNLPNKQKTGFFGRLFENIAHNLIIFIVVAFILALLIRQMLK